MSAPSTREVASKLVHVRKIPPRMRRFGRDVRVYNSSRLKKNL